MATVSVPSEERFWKPQKGTLSFYFIFSLKKFVRLLLNVYILDMYVMHTCKTPGPDNKQQPLIWHEHAFPDCAGVLFGHKVVTIININSVPRHWLFADVTVGAIIGLVVCYSCYRQVYPSLYKMNSHLSYSQFPPVADSFDSSREDQDTPTSPHPKSRETEFTFVSKIV